jgi:hypothetical protein
VDDRRTVGNLKERDRAIDASEFFRNNVELFAANISPKKLKTEASKIPVSEAICKDKLAEKKVSES